MHSRDGPSLYTGCTAGAEGPQQLESKGPQNQLHGDIHKQCHMEQGAVPLVLCRGGKHAYSPAQSCLLDTATLGPRQGELGSSPSSAADWLCDLT